ncbi:MAG: Maf family protein [Treponema sp.]|nr:Maf family protein [Treponema sp.]
MDPIILASSSPRRQEILTKMNIPFTVMPSQIDESYPENLAHEKIPEYLAIEKLKVAQKNISKDLESFWILGADTLVLLDDKIYGKPEDQDYASDMMHELQGKTHTVVTGIVLFKGKKHSLSTRTSVNKVTFASMTDEEIDWYMGTGEWHGVAGGYRIQGQASCFIKSIEGTSSSIMGLPIFELYDMLKEQGYTLL